MVSEGRPSQLPGPWLTTETARSGALQPRTPLLNSCSGQASPLKLHYPRGPGVRRALTPGTRLRRRKAKETAEAVQKAMHERYDYLDRKVQDLSERLAARGRSNTEQECEEEDWGDNPGPCETTTVVGVGRAEGPDGEPGFQGTLWQRRTRGTSSTVTPQDQRPTQPRSTTGSRDQRLNDLGLVVISLAGTQADLGAGVTKDASRSRREARERELVSHDPQAWLCISHRVQQGQAERALVGSSFKRQAVINYPGMPVSKERADQVLHDLEGLANLLLLAYRWDLNLPLPPEFPELDIQVLRDPECPRGLELGYQDIRSARTALRRWVLLLRRLVYHLGAEGEATHLLQNIVDALGLCIEGSGLEDEPCLVELREQNTMREAVHTEWEAVKTRARATGGDADTRVVVEEPPAPSAQAPQQLQVPPREVMSPPVQAMGPPPPSPRSQEAPRGLQSLREPQEPASPDSGAVALLAQGPATPATPTTTGVMTPPSTSATQSSPRHTPWLLDSARVGRGKRVRELQRPTPGSPGVNLRVDPKEEAAFLESHGV